MDPAPRVLEQYRATGPRPEVSAVVEQMLSRLPDGYFARFGHVALRDSGSLTREERIKRKTAGASKALLGTYYGPTARQPAHIDLFVDAIFDGRSHLVSRIPPVRDLLVGRVLFHELGHHLHRVVRPENRNREVVAEEWRKELLGSYFRRTYWYLLPLLWPIYLLGRALKPCSKESATSSS